MADVQQRSSSDLLIPVPDADCNSPETRLIIPVDRDSDSAFDFPAIGRARRRDRVEYIHPLRIHKRRSSPVRPKTPTKPSPVSRSPDLLTDSPLQSQRNAPKSPFKPISCFPLPPPRAERGELVHERPAHARDKLILNMDTTQCPVKQISSESLEIRADFILAQSMSRSLEVKSPSRPLAGDLAQCCDSLVGTYQSQNTWP